MVTLPFFLRWLIGPPNITVCRHLLGVGGGCNSSFSLPTCLDLKSAKRHTPGWVYKGYFLEWLTEGARPFPGEGGTFCSVWECRGRREKSLLFACLSSPLVSKCIQSAVAAATTKTILRWHWNSASSVFQHGFRTSDSSGIPQTFSTGLLVLSIQVRCMWFLA